MATQIIYTKNVGGNLIKVNIDTDDITSEKTLRVRTSNGAGGTHSPNMTESEANDLIAAIEAGFASGV